MLDTRTSVFIRPFGLKSCCSIGCIIGLLKNVLMWEVGDWAHGDCTQGDWAHGDWAHGDVARFTTVDGVWVCMGLLRW